MPQQIVPYSLDYLKRMNQPADDEDESESPSPLDGKGTVGDLMDSDPSLDAKGAEFKPGAQVALARDVTPKTQAPPASDEVKASAAAPKLDLSPLTPGLKADDISVTRAELQKAANAKREAALMGALGDNLSSRQSFGNFFLGHLNPQNHSGAQLAQVLGEQAMQPIETKLALQKQALQAPELQTAQAALSKDSDFSKAKQNELATHIGLLSKFGQLDQKKADELLANVQNLNGFQAGKILDSMKPLSEAMKAQAQLALAGRKLDQGDMRLGMQQDTQAAKAAHDVHQDPLIKQYNQQDAQIYKGLGLLRGNAPITGQVASEEAANFAAILSGARGAGVEQTRKMEYNNAQGELAKFLQWADGHPRDALPKELRESMAEAYDRLAQAIHEQRAIQAKRTTIGKSFAHNPAAQRAQEEAIQHYQNATPGGDQGYSVVPEAHADQAKGPHGATVYQNGHMYTWNPQTKRYE